MTILSLTDHSSMCYRDSVHSKVFNTAITLLCNYCSFLGVFIHVTCDRNRDSDCTVYSMTEYISKTSSGT